jgi:hypothetical protein
VEVKGQDDVDIHSSSLHQYSGGLDLGTCLMPVGLAAEDLRGLTPSRCQRVPRSGTSWFQYLVSHLLAFD